MLAIIWQFNSGEAATKQESEMVWAATKAELIPGTLQLHGMHNNYSGKIVLYFSDKF